MVSRLMTVFWGAFATLYAVTLSGSGSVIEKVNQIGSFFYGSLLGVFTLGLLVKRAGPRAGLAGLVGGMASVGLTHWLLRVEFLWYNVIGCVGVLLVGGIVAWIEPRRAETAA